MDEFLQRRGVLIDALLDKIIGGIDNEDCLSRRCF